MSESNTMAYVNHSFTFFRLAYQSNFSSVRTVFCRFFTWISLGDVNFSLSLILVTNTNVAEGGTTSAMCLCYCRDQPIHVTDGVTDVTFC